MNMFTSMCFACLMIAQPITSLQLRQRTQTSVSSSPQQIGSKIGSGIGTSLRRCWPDELAAAVILTDTYHNLPGFFDKERNPYMFTEVHTTQISGGCWRLIGFKGNMIEAPAPVMSSWTNRSHCFRAWAGLTGLSDFSSAIDVGKILLHGAHPRLDKLNFPLLAPNVYSKMREELTGQEAGHNSYEFCKLNANWQAEKELGDELFQDYITNEADMAHCLDKPGILAAHSNGGAMVSLGGYCAQYDPVFGPFILRTPLYTFGARSYYRKGKGNDFSYPGPTRRYVLVDQANGGFDPVPFLDTDKPGMYHWGSEPTFRLDVSGEIVALPNLGDHKQEYEHLSALGIVEHSKGSIGMHDMCNYLGAMLKNKQYQALGLDTKAEMEERCGMWHQIKNMIAQDKMKNYQEGEIGKELGGTFELQY